MFALLQQDTSKDVPYSPQERVDAVRPFWESLSQEERVKLLTIDLTALRERARQVTETARQQAGEARSQNQYQHHSFFSKHFGPFPLCQLRSLVAKSLGHLLITGFY